MARDIAPLRVGGSDNPPVWRNPALASHVLSVGALCNAGAGQRSTVRAAIHEMEPNMITIARNLQGWIDQVTEEIWNVVTLIVILGLVATALATTGIYGAVSFAVNQRTRDLGIRVALGAQRTDIVREVFLMGGRPVVRGLLLGGWMSIAMAATLRENLKSTPLRIDSSDPLVYGSAIVLLAIAAVMAMIGPARRGSNSDPLDALRCE